MERITDRRSRGTDEGHLRLFAQLGEEGVLGQKTVTRMDGAAAGLLCRLNDRFHVEVALGAFRRTDADALIGHLQMWRRGICLRVDGNGGDAHLTASANDATRNLTAVGYQDPLEHGLSGVGGLRIP
jgi:hypothetical protein